MSALKYTAIVTVSLVCPKGKVLKTKTDTVPLEVEAKDFKDHKDADSYVKGELSTLLAAGTSNIEACFV